jgi:hypothetical protein
MLFMSMGQDHVSELWPPRGLPFIHQMMIYIKVESQDGMILTRENQRTWRKTCPSAILSTTNPTWPDPSVNPGLHGERLATNHLSHGMPITNQTWGGGSISRVYSSLNAIANLIYWHICYNITSVYLYF